MKDTEIIIRLRRRWFQGNYPVVVFDRLIKFAHGPESHRAVIIGLIICRIKGNGLIEVLDGLIQPADLEKSHAEITVCINIRWSQCDCLVKVRKGFFKLASLVIN